MASIFAIGKIPNGTSSGETVSLLYVSIQYAIPARVSHEQLSGNRVRQIVLGGYELLFITGLYLLVFYLLVFYY